MLTAGIFRLGQAIPSRHGFEQPAGRTMPNDRQTGDLHRNITFFQPCSVRVAEGHEPFVKILLKPR